MSGIVVPPPPPLRTYVLNFDATQTNLPSLNNYLMDAKGVVVKFWNYIPYSYFIKSHWTAETLAPRFSPFFSGRYFIIAEVHNFNINGSLPPSAWDWFYDRESPNTGLVPSLPGGLADLFRK